VEPKPARPGFVHETQPTVRCAQRPDHVGHGLQVAGDHPVAADLAVSPFLGERDIDRFLVDIHPHEHATFRHDLPPLYVVRRVTLIGFAQSTTYYVRQVSCPTAANHTAILSSHSPKTALCLRTARREDKRGHGVPTTDNSQQRVLVLILLPS
jgi:hypothetical protein